MTVFRLLWLLLQVALLLSAAVGEPDWSSLAVSLSSEAALHGPIFDSDFSECRALGTNPFAISESANGICMQAFDCGREFCQADLSYNLPSYSADVRTEEDVAKVLAFAANNSVHVSVKTSGHSYQGSSTQAGSLLVWMHNYPKDDTIIENYQDSCGTVVEPAVIGIGGGETIDDVLEAVKGDYHVVTGSCRTVSAAGGWLQGGGLSFTSRQYGLGVDQVVDFRVVLANGTTVTADACTNPDLFWALRGGGGGTFGVVTHVHYKLHPVTTIVQVDYSLLIGENTPDEDEEAIGFAVDQWLDYWIQKSPTLDSRWGGIWSLLGAHLLFIGTLEDAKTTFINDLQDWYENVLDKSKMKVNIWGSLVFGPTVHTNWYEYKGGENAAGNPETTDPTGDAYAGIAGLAGRLMPQSYVANKPDDVKALLLDQRVSPYLGVTNYLLGGNINSVPIDETAVHPALRDSVWNIFTVEDIASQIVREFIPNDVTGVCYNHHNRIEPDWRNACWGENYDRLSQVKEMNDPDHLFNCWHCVGYNGTELESDIKVPTPMPTPSIAVHVTVEQFSLVLLSSAILFLL